LAVNSPCLDSFACIAKWLVTCDEPAGQLLTSVLAATSNSDKVSNLTRWLVAANFRCPPAYKDPGAFLRNPDEGAACMHTLFTLLMACVANPAFGPARPRVIEDRTEFVIEGSSALSAEALCEHVRRYVDALVRSSSMSVALVSSALNHTARRFAAYGGGAAASRPLTTDEETDRSSFTLNHPLIADVCPRDQLDPLQEAIDKHYVHLRQVFRHYAGDDGTPLASAITMQPVDFYRLLLDCRAMLPGVVTKETISDVAPNAMDPRRWLCAVVRVAKVVAAKPLIRPCLEAFFELLLPLAEVPDVVSAPKAARDDQALAGMLATYRSDIFKVFRSYADGGKLTLPAMVASLRDSGTLNQDLSESAVTRVFNRVKSTVAEDGIGFDAFIEALCWCAAFSSRDPFQHTAFKVRKFVFSRFLPAFRAKLKLTFAPQG
jgi:hypothetical protein